jgi:hypothetical protein
MCVAGGPGGPSVRLKGGDKRGFMFSSEGTIFTFGKKYLNSQQHQELRRLSELALFSSSPVLTRRSVQRNGDQ